MSISKNVPLESDWGDTSNRDIYYAFKNFNGKSNSDMRSAFQENIMTRCEDLSWMPIKPFLYYIFGLKQLIESGGISEDDISSAVDYFFSLIEKKAKEHPSEIASIYSELRPLLEKIAKKQEAYDADIDIYGDFSLKLQKLDELISEEGD